MGSHAVQVFLEAAAKDFERLKERADRLGDDLSLLAYLLAVESKEVVHPS